VTATETLAAIREAPGLEDYLDAIEERLARTVASHPGVVAAVGNEALAAGGKRLRPLLVFLAAPPGTEPSLAAGVAVELVHMATLVHDDLIDRAHFRRGKAAAWSVHGADAARATGDYLFARAFAELAATGDADAVEILADATLCLARGEALQRTQTHDPSTTVAAYLERCALKTGKLFEASCRLGGGSGDYGLALGVAFQIADDVLDVTQSSEQLGKTAGKDVASEKVTYPALFGIEESLRKADSLVDSGCAALASFGSRAETLKALAKFLVERKK
jgi:geranylgeranyl pyrophosphate synthase